MTRAKLMAKKIKLKAKFDAVDDDAIYEKLKSDADKQDEISKKIFWARRHQK